MKKQLNKQIVEIPSHLKRVNYFNGQLLTQADLEIEQTYFIERQRLHNRYIHGCGVVSGLAVSVSKDSPCSLKISPGVALDAWGHEIILTADVRISCPEKGDVAHLFLFWAERETDFVPAPTSNGEGDEKVASRVEEYAILKYEIEDSSAKRKTEEKGEESHNGIVLARLKKVRGIWKVDKKFHVHRANT